MLVRQKMCLLIVRKLLFTYDYKLSKQKKKEA